MTYQNKITNHKMNKMLNPNTRLNIPKYFQESILDLSIIELLLIIIAFSHQHNLEYQYQINQDVCRIYPED